MDEFAEFQAQLRRPIEDKCREFHRADRLRHLINAAQLTPALLSSLCSAADKIRRLARDELGNRRLRELLAHKRAMLYFTQPSTRRPLRSTTPVGIVGAH